MSKINSPENKKVLVVSHGGTLMLALNHLLNKELKTENADRHKNGYVSYLKLDKDLNLLDALINVDSSKLAQKLKAVPEDP